MFLKKTMSKKIIQFSEAEIAANNTANNTDSPISIHVQRFTR